jgi:hypothetical protein
MKKLLFAIVLAALIPVQAWAVTRYTSVITHDSSYAKQGARAKRSYTDSLNKSDSIFARSAKVSGTVRADSTFTRAGRVGALLESKYLTVKPDLLHQLTMDSIGLIYNDGFARCSLSGTLPSSIGTAVLSVSNPISLTNIRLMATPSESEISLNGTSLVDLKGPSTFFLRGGSVMFAGAGVAPTYTQHFLTIDPIDPTGTTTYNTGITFTRYNGSFDPKGALYFRQIPGWDDYVPLVFEGGFASTLQNGGIEFNGKRFFQTDIYTGTLKRRRIVADEDSSTTLYNITADSIDSKKINLSSTLKGTSGTNPNFFKLDSSGFKFHDTYCEIEAGSGGGNGFLTVKNPNSLNSLSFYALYPGRNAVDLQGYTEFFTNNFANFAMYGAWAGHGGSVVFDPARTGTPGRGQLTFLHQANTNDYVNIVMDPLLCSVPEDGGLEYFDASFWGTSTAKGRRKFVQQSDTITSPLILTGQINLSGYNPAPSFSEMWFDTTGVTRLLPLANTFYGVRVFRKGLTSSGIVRDTADTSGSKYLFTSASAGTYKVGYSVSYKTSATDTMHFTIFLNNVQKNNISSETFASTASTLMCQSSSGFVSIAATDTLRLKVSCTSIAHTIAINHVNFSLNRISN